MSSQNLLEIREIGYQYIKNKPSVFTGISFQIQSGSTLGIQGHNGCGKSTLLKIIASILSPSSGEIRYNGEAISKSLSQYRNLVNYSAGGPQGFYPRLSAVENLLFFSGIKGKPLSKNDIHRILDRVALTPDARDKKYFQYSLGMRQRMHIAKLLLDPSEIILADEPTNGLDQEGIRLAKDVFNQDLKSKIKIIISHEETFLESVSNDRFKFPPHHGENRK